MTDLEEALPILEHNTNSTFHAMMEHDPLGTQVGPAKGDGLGPSGKAFETEEAVGIHRVQRPAIRRLRWGSRADFTAVSGAAALSSGEQRAEPRRKGFDMIVVGSATVADYGVVSNEKLEPNRFDKEEENMANPSSRGPPSMSTPMTKSDRTPAMNITVASPSLSAPPSRESSWCST